MLVSNSKMPDHASGPSNLSALLCIAKQAEKQRHADCITYCPVIYWWQPQGYPIHM
jgi:hypothetical protein